ncbi:MAG: hypothetical protein IJD56_00250 [Peptococcaceae bacterium]|nr:hypothetical protein [Peptococcaceae bacterium]
MKKWKAILVMLLVLLVPCQAAWAVGDNLVPTGNLQLMFAQLQQEQAEIIKQQAMQQMKETAALQAEQRQVSGYLDQARSLQSEAEASDSATAMPGEMQEYMLKNGLAYDTTGDDLDMTYEEWDVAISSLESRMEMLGVQTQQLMVNVQEFIGAYNANQQVNGNQTISSLSRGQSMYGDSSAGLMITTLIVGMVLGCLITVAAEKMMKKGKRV